MEVRPGYKQTEVGVIPEDWEAKACSEVCEKIQDGTHFSPKIGGNDYLYVTSKNIRFGYVDLATADRIDAIQHASIYKRCDVKHGDLLLTKDGANTGNAALNDLDEEFSLLSSVAFLRFDPRRHDAGYFLQQILSTPGQQQIKEAMSGNAITRLTLEKINKLRFPTPKSEEQRAIAVALSDVDALLAKLDQFIAKKRGLKQAAMQQLLTGQTRLPGFSGEWEVKRLGELFEVTAGGDLDKPKFSTEKTADFPFPIYANSLYDAGIYGYSSQYRHPANTITITARGSLGYAFYRNQNYTAIGRLIVMKSIVGLDGFFISELINAVSEFANESTSIPQLTAPKIIRHEILIPQIVEEQTAIATVLSGMDAEIAALEARRDKTRALKQGMMQELLTGRIRLV